MKVARKLSPLVLAVLVLAISAPVVAALTWLWQSQQIGVQVEVRGVMGGVYDPTWAAYDGQTDASALGDMLLTDMHGGKAPLNQCVTIVVEDSFLGGSTIEIGVSSVGAPADLVITCTGYYASFVDYNSDQVVNYFDGGQEIAIPVDGASTTLTLAHIEYLSPPNENPEVIANANAIILAFDFDTSGLEDPSEWGVHSFNLVIELGEA